MSRGPEWARISDAEWEAMTADERAAHSRRVYEWRKARQKPGTALDEQRALAGMSNRAARRHAQMTQDRAW